MTHSFLAINIKHDIISFIYAFSDFVARQTVALEFCNNNLCQLGVNVD